jgi:hypothetical protein
MDMGLWADTFGEAVRNRSVAVEAALVDEPAGQQNDLGIG